MRSMLRLYDVNNVVLGTVDCEDSVWLLRGGLLENQYPIFVPIEQQGYAARMRLGNWVIDAGKVGGLDCRLDKGSTVVFTPGKIVVEMTVRDEPGLLTGREA